MTSNSSFIRYLLTMVIACVRTRCSVVPLLLPCCRAWPGTCTVSFLGWLLGLFCWAGMVIWTGTRPFGSVIVICFWGPELAAAAGGGGCAPPITVRPRMEFILLSRIAASLTCTSSWIIIIWSITLVYVDCRKVICSQSILFLHISINSYWNWINMIYVKIKDMSFICHCSLRQNH